MPSAKQKTSLRKSQTKRPQRIAAMVFAAFTIGFFALVAYFAFSQSTITVVVAPEPISTNFAVTLHQKPLKSAEEAAITGIVYAEKVTAEKTIRTFGTTTAKPAKASGTVTIHNAWSRPQPLAATTRLLSESGVLFRTAQRVDVPAGGTVTVTVTADETGGKGNVEPGRFTVPGLSGELQEKIYATSDAAMTGGLQTTTTLTDADLNAAYEEAEKEALAALQAKLESLSEEPPIVKETATIEKSTRSASAEAGDEVSEVTVKVIVEGQALGFNEQEVRAYAATELSNALANGERLTDVVPTLRYQVRSSDLKAQTAILDVAAAGQKTVTAQHTIFNRDQLTRKTRAQLRDYFQGFSYVRRSSVQFSPFWSRMSPSAGSRITVKVEAEDAVP